MLLSLLHRITRVGACWHRLSGLVRQTCSRGLFISTLAVIVVTTVLILSLSGCAASSYSANWLTSTSTLCQSCHGTGEVAYVDEEKIVSKEGQCVLPVKEMMDSHKDLLNDWEKSVVREGDRIYVASDGEEYNMNLIDTCMKCHPNKKEFCDECHSYTAVTPSCWNCHKLAPQGDGSGNK